MNPDFEKKIQSAAIPVELAVTLKQFLDAFENLPEKPHVINPHYMRAMLNILVNEVTDPNVEYLWWEMILNLANKSAAPHGKAGRKVAELIKKLSPQLEAHLDNDDSQVTLQEVSMDTVNGIILLSETLSEPKKYFVAPNANSLAQAHFSDYAWFRAIHAGKAPVGFVMIVDNAEEAQYFIWRLMIGEPYYRRGYGRKAIMELVEYIKTRPGAKEVLVSCGEGEGTPLGFYEKIGFTQTGEKYGDEIVLKMLFEVENEEKEEEKTDPE